MDAVSIAASIAGLVTFADAIVQRGYKYIKDIKESEKEVAALIEEVNIRSKVLHGPYTISLVFESQGFRAESTMQVHLIEACKKSLETVNAHLTESDPSAAKDGLGKTFRKLKWTYNKSISTDLMFEVHKHRSQLSMATTVTEMSAYSVCCPAKARQMKFCFSYSKRLQRTDH